MKYSDTSLLAQEQVLDNDLIRVSSDNNDLLDRLLSGSSSAYDREFTIERLEWIKESVSHHIKHCPQYALLAKGYGFSPDELKKVSDLVRVPLVPSSLFKKKSVISLVSGELLQCQSSGTKGSVSNIYRDEPTMERFVAGMLHGASEFYERLHEGRRGFVLGPTTEDAGTLWFSYALSLLDLSFDTEFFVRDEEFHVEELALSLSNLEPGIQPLIVGPPVLLVEFCRWLIRQGKQLNFSECNALVVTAGGWKSFSDTAIDRTELTNLVVDALGVKPISVRDVYNMVELNSQIFECEFKTKHVPPWLEVIVRDPSDLSSVEIGNEGVLTFLDPTPTSYPGFIFSDDVGLLEAAPCACGRKGQTLKIIRRLAKVEERGCALKMGRYCGG